MSTRRYFSLLLSVVMLFALWAIPASASDDKIVSSQRINFEDGSYLIETVVEENATQITRATSTKSGYKNSTYYTADNVAIYTVRVTGSFEYTGTSSKATSASATVYLNHASATYISKSAFCSGISAYATGSVSYSGKTLSRSVALSCSATGVLS